MKKIIKVIAIILFSIIILGATIFSIAKFNVYNPISSCLGMLEILFTNKQYTVVQRYPNRVIFSKENDSNERLNEYMKDRGFDQVPEKRMGSILVYSNGTVEEVVLCYGGAYYSRWEWR